MSMGYENAAITQVMSGLTLLLGWYHGSSSISSLDLFKLGEGQLWRLLLSQLIFENTAETVVGLMLLYYFRQFERQMGTRKFGFFLFLSLLISLFNLITFEILLLSVDIVYVPASGPYFLIFSMLSIFYSRVPRLKNSGYQLFGLMISEKSWTYLLAGQLAISGGLSTVVPALSGLFVGYMYDKDYCGMQSYRFPRIVESAFGFVGRFIVSFIPTSAPTPRAPVGGRPGGPGGAPTGQGRGPAPVAMPPPEEAIETLMGMGFDRAAVVSALQTNDNNVESAANMLLR